MLYVHPCILPIVRTKRTAVADDDLRVILVQIPGPGITVFSGEVTDPDSRALICLCRSHHKEKREEDREEALKEMKMEECFTLLTIEVGLAKSLVAVLATLPAARPGAAALVVASERMMPNNAAVCGSPMHLFLKCVYSCQRLPPLDLLQNR